MCVLLGECPSAEAVPEAARKRCLLPRSDPSFEERSAARKSGGQARSRRRCPPYPLPPNGSTVGTALAGTYFLLDVWLQARRHREGAQCALLDAEILPRTTVWGFDGNFRAVRRRLPEQRCRTAGPRRIHYNRRLQRGGPLLDTLVDWLGRVHEAFGRRGALLTAARRRPATTVAFETAGSTPYRRQRTTSEANHSSRHGGQ